MAFRNSPPPAHSRRRVGAPLDLGVRALNTFLTCCRGQRLGIFAGSGVGKSVLLSMLARNVDADVSVIGLVGERGREVQEFLQDDLGDEGLARSVVVVATSDEPALMRRQAAFLTLAIAECLVWTGGRPGASGHADAFAAGVLFYVPALVAISLPRRLPGLLRLLGIASAAPWTLFSAMHLVGETPAPSGALAIAGYVGLTACVIGWAIWIVRAGAPRPA